MDPQNLWSDPNVPQQGFSLPVSIGPMALPPQKPKRRWRGVLAWVLVAFAAGVAAGPPLVEYASQGLDAGAAMLAKRWPGRFGRYQPGASEVAPPPPQRVVLGARPAVQAVPAQPVAPPAAVAPEEPLAGASAPRVAVAALPPTPAPSERAERPSRMGRGKSAARPSASSSVRRGGRSHDPFAVGDGAGAVTEAASKAASPDPGSRAAASKSSDPLDNLLAGAVTDSKGKSSSKKTSRDIDVMLKDVQKSDGTPGAKPKAQAEAAPLSPSEIAKVMAGVKARSHECARKSGQKGIAQLNLNVGKNGKVTDVKVGGKVAGTPLADCVEKAARAATFRPNTGLRFDYKIDAR